MVAGLHLAKELSIIDIRGFTDSMVVASQIRGEFEVHDPILQRCLVKVKGLIGGLNHSSSSMYPKTKILKQITLPNSPPGTPAPHLISPLQSSSIRCRDGFDASVVVFGLGEGVLHGGYEDFVALPFFVLFFPTTRFFLDRFLFEIFRSTCFIHKLSPGKSKLDPRLTTCIFLGYSKIQKDVNATYLASTVYNPYSSRRDPVVPPG
ncbi:hypothetical protein KSP39_PZI001892 [Platanthera zijinensis]|uniref:Retroviral polymerase SH3-like domain-containing protein n=1 Tax=Platanthera zijinensis TaxID=2320716 RepID=A0AAP0C0D1_9ASPA